MKTKPFCSHFAGLTALLLNVLVLPALGPALAANRDWMVASGDWNVPENWSGSAVPTSSESVLIDNGTALVPTGVYAEGSSIAIGESGSGSLSIAGGEVYNIGGYLGFNSGSSGTATLSGGGSEWVLTSSLLVGVDGTGTIQVSGGAEVCNYDFGSLGYNNGSIGTVTVDGTGSLWMTSLLSVGIRGSGTLNVTNGGSVYSLSGEIGSNTGGDGTVLVDGATWTDTGNLTIGGLGTATLTVSNGGAVNAGGLVTVGTQGTVHGDGSISGNMSNAGLVAPGPGAPGAGALQLSGNYTQTSSGKLQIQLGGLDAGDEYDQLLVTGDVTLGGVLQVTLIDGFTPALLDSFNILGFTSHSGAFATVQLPALGSSLAWDTSQLYTDGILAVVGADGDYDDDNDVDAADIDILWYIVRGSGADPNDNDTADLNGDTFVNEDDVDTMLASKLDAGTNRAYGDADLSGGTPELTDYNLWRTGTGGWAQGDFDGSGGVPELTDYNLWRTGPTQFLDTVGSHGGGGGPGAPMVPEPASFLLVAIAFGHFLVVRRLQGFRRS